MGELTLDNYQISRMAKDPSFVQLVPCLEPILKAQTENKQQRRGCCGNRRTASSIPHNSFDAARRCLDSMLKGSPELRATLKKKLGATTLRLKYRGTHKIIVSKY